MKKRITAILLTVSLFVTGLICNGKNNVKALEKPEEDLELIQKPESSKCLEETTKHLIELKTPPSVEEAEKYLAQETLKKKQEEKQIMISGSVEEGIRCVSIKYGIDADIAVAISRLETGHWKSNPFKKYNNVGGMKYRGKIMKFDSLNEGIERFVKNLKKNYFDQGLNTPAKMQKKYCPPNSDWDEMVVKIMEMRMNRL